jgi:hypothetical protein
MRNRLWAVSLAALGLAGGLVSQATAQAEGGHNKSQSRAAFSIDGTVQDVDADRDRVTFKADDGHAYTLDTYQADISLRDTQKSGQTGDLVPGMRLHITGERLSGDVIEADQVSVLPYRDVKPTAPARHDAPAVPDPNTHVTLRGTVQSVDTHRGMFVVQINDHTRKVFVDDETDLRDLNGTDDDRLPLHSGDRVSVVGDIQDDGTVQATLVTPRRLDDVPPAPVASVPVQRSAPVEHVPDFGVDAQHERTLLGRISKESEYFSRDIKIRVSVSHEISVHVPKGIPIRRDGEAISVHDLKDDQVVRVTGDYVNDDFKATRIELLDDSAGDRLDF